MFHSAVLYTTAVYLLYLLYLIYLLYLLYLLHYSSSFLSVILLLSVELDTAK